ncbi:MAG: response regulator [Chitinophagales bacterium]|nr:response regulator [Chitinophagales bacterium]
MSFELDQKYDLLLVEDNPGDVRLTQEILKDSRYVGRLHLAQDGEEAISFLFKEGRYQDSPTPHLVILDLNLPKRNGLEVLQEMKSNAKTNHIPVIILTSSESKQDIQNCYKLNANAYLTKPVDFDKYQHMIKYIEQFWFSLIKLPVQ